MSYVFRCHCLKEEELVKSSQESKALRKQVVKVSQDVQKMQFTLAREGQQKRQAGVVVRGLRETLEYLSRERDRGV